MSNTSPYKAWKRRRRARQFELDRSEAERAAALSVAGPAAAAPAAASPAGPTTPATASPAPPSSPRAERSTTAGFSAAAATTTVAVCAAIALGFPTWGHGWQLRELVASAAVAVAAGVGAQTLWDRAAVRVRLTVTSLCTLAVVAFAVGAAGSLVIDGEVIRDSSDTAAAYRLSEDAMEDMTRFQDVDTYLTLSVEEARARFGEFDRLIAEMRSTSAAWAVTDPASVPSGQYIDIARSMASAANYAAEALVAKQMLLLEADVRLEQKLIQNRGAFIGEVAKAGPLLVEVGDLYGFDLRPHADEEVVE